MKITPIVFVALLVSCTKNIDAPSVTKQAEDRTLESCDFGIRLFNKAKRAASPETFNQKKKPRENGPVLPPNATIFLDFDGQLVSQTLWNKNGDIYMAPANLKAIEIDKITERVIEDFSPFNVIVTTDEEVYKVTNPYKRMRVVITESWEWYGVAGGIAYNNSFVWGNSTPCFIFSTLLGYNEKYIAEAISHEVGHTLGLLHQASYDASCNYLSEFNQGFGEGVTGWAPIMGIGYYRNLTTWHKGPTVFGCGEIQDDVAIISGVLGMKPDDSSEMNKMDQMTVSNEGLINSSSDVDYYFVDVKQPLTVVAEPNCLPNEEGANINLRLLIYDKNRVLIKTVSDPTRLSARIVLDKDKYYIGVETEADPGEIRYGMLGRYVLRTN